MKWSSQNARALVWLVTGAGLSDFAGTARAASAAETHMQVYIGTYTSGKSQGIYLASFDPATGKLGVPELAVATKNPSFLAVHPNQRWVYAVAEMNNFGGQRTGAVSAFRRDTQTGKLILLN